MTYAAIIVGSWLLTLITYQLGYSKGKEAGVNELYAESKAAKPKDSDEETVTRIDAQ